MRALICGGRTFDDRAHMWASLDRIEQKWGKISAVIEGGATGADRLARGWARARGLPVLTVEADWDYYRKCAGSVRNNWMLKHGRPDVVIAFNGGNDTANMIQQANDHHIQVIRA